MGHRPRPRTFTQRLRAMHKADRDREKRLNALARKFAAEQKKLGINIATVHRGSVNLMSEALRAFKNGERKVVQQVIVTERETPRNREALARALKTFAELLRKEGFRVTQRPEKAGVTVTDSWGSDIVTLDVIKLTVSI